MRIINEIPRFEQQLYKALRHYPPLLRKISILTIKICLLSGVHVSPQAQS